MNSWCDEIGWCAVQILQALPPGPDDASVFQDYIEYALTEATFVVRREVRCARGPTRGGRIDLVATWRPGTPLEARIALELDWRQPRYKSLQKLRLFDGYRIVVLRLDKPYPHPLPGIDAVVCIPVIDPLKPFLAGQATLSGRKEK